jgi:L-alanine-DL-glutamate epimerase-like enolase superfamily enzyme
MARIERVELRVVGPDIARTTWASMPPQFMALTVARVWDSDGACGVGASENYSSSGFDLSGYESARALAPLIVGEEASHVEARWRDLQANVMPSVPGAAAVLDIALWDLAAKRAGLPLYKFLGGSRDQILAYASTPQMEDVSAYLTLVGELASEGFTAVKFHAWNYPDRDLEMLRAVHGEYADAGITFMHDAENRYEPYDALRVGRELQEMGYRWFEAPFRDYDLHSYRHLRRHLSIPIVPHGLWISDLRELAAYLSQDPWDALRFDASAIGITVGRKIAALAEAWALPVEVQSWGYSLIQAPNLHLALSVAGSTYFESPIPYEAYEFAVANPIRCDASGIVQAPSGDGLGLEILWDEIEAATLAQAEITTGVRGRELPA